MPNQVLAVSAKLPFAKHHDGPDPALLFKQTQTQLLGALLEAITS
jgi:hypothetical protein